MGQVNYAKYGADALSTDNYGMDVTKPYVPSSTPTSIGQGLATNLYYAEGTVSYLINPKYNLRFEAGALFRAEKTALADNKTVLITFGLRSTFRDIVP